jgi:hypothetical protein
VDSGETPSIGCRRPASRRARTRAPRRHRLPHLCCSRHSTRSAPTTHMAQSVGLRRRPTPAPTTAASKTTSARLPHYHTGQQWPSPPFRQTADQEAGATAATYGRRSAPPSKSVLDDYPGGLSCSLADTRSCADRRLPRRTPPPNGPATGMPQGACTPRQGDLVRRSTLEAGQRQIPGNLLNCRLLPRQFGARALSVEFVPEQGAIDARHRASAQPFRRTATAVSPGGLRRRVITLAHSGFLVLPD